ncbi:MAG: hypothetical protein WED05_10215 [Candidatus Atabeyarchaeum deiterrae]
MKKNLAFGLVVLTLFLLLSVTFPSTKAASYTQLGVHAGDTADYTVRLGGFFPNTAVNAARVTFWSVSGSYISGTFTIYGPNHGESSTYTISGDASSGTNHIYWYAIAINLTKDDPIYSGATMKIDETITLAIAGESRIVNHFVGAFDGVYYDLYWDKETGLMVKSYICFPDFVENLTLTSTTVFSFGYYPVKLVLVGGAVAVAVLAVIIALRKRK